MKINTYIILPATAILMALASCNEKHLCDLPHPHPGTLHLTYGWGTFEPSVDEVELDLKATIKPAEILMPWKSWEGIWEDEVVITPARGTYTTGILPYIWQATAYTGLDELIKFDGNTFVTELLPDGTLPDINPIAAGRGNFEIWSDEETNYTIPMKTLARPFRMGFRFTGSYEYMESMEVLIDGFYARSSLGQESVSRALPLPGKTYPKRFALLEENGELYITGSSLGADSVNAIPLYINITYTDDSNQQLQMPLTPSFNGYNDFSNGSVFNLGTMTINLKANAGITAEITDWEEGDSKDLDAWN